MERGRPVPGLAREAELLRQYADQLRADSDRIVEMGHGLLARLAVSAGAPEARRRGSAGGTTPDDDG